MGKLDKQAISVIFLGYSTTIVQSRDNDAILESRHVIVQEGDFDRNKYFTGILIINLIL
jgi:hypothetical protein